MVTFKNMFMSRLFFFLCLLPTQYLLAQNGQPDSVVKKDLVLAKRYLDGAGGQAKNEAAAFTLIQKHAAAGVAEAMNMAGICYNEGLGVAKNRKTAIDWLVQSGRLNYAQAWYNLGMLYRTAQNEDERDFSKAYAALLKLRNWETRKVNTPLAICSIREWDAPKITPKHSIYF
jgi:TPR repeat protein